MNIKKLFLSLGSASAIVLPVATVVACGTGGSETEYSQEDQDIISKASLPAATQKLEYLWMQNVLADQYGIDSSDKDALNTSFEKLSVMEAKSKEFADDFKEAAIWLLQSKVVTANNGLTDIVKEIQTADVNKKIEKTDYDDLVVQYFSLGAQEAIAPSIDIAKLFFDVQREEGKIVYNPLRISIKAQVMKLLITKNYSSITRKELSQTLGEEKYNEYDSAVRRLTKDGTKNFPLITEAMKKRISLKWTVALDAKDSDLLIPMGDKDEYKFDDAVKVITNAAPYDTLKWSTQNAKTSVGLDDYFPEAVSTNNYLGFSGFAELPAGTSKALSSSFDDLKAQGTTPVEGFLSEEELKTNDPNSIIKFGSPISVTFFKSLMPQYDDATGVKELTFKTGLSTNKLSYFLTLSDAGFYDDAVTYYTTRKDAAGSEGKDTSIKVEVKNEDIKKIFEDAGVNYIK